MVERCSARTRKPVPSKVIGKAAQQMGASLPPWDKALRRLNPLQKVPPPCPFGVGWTNSSGRGRVEELGFRIASCEVIVLFDARDIGVGYGLFSAGYTAARALGPYAHLIAARWVVYARSGENARTVDQVGT